MLLVIDIGNSDVVFGIFKEKTLVGTWRIASDLHKASDEYGMLMCNLLTSHGISADAIKGVILSSVVPPLTPLFQEMSQRYFSIDPMIVSDLLKTGLTIQYDNPKEVGSDRIVNAAAAYQLYGGPLVIVDLGTATTFCVVSETGAYLGGVIAPGMALSAEALVKRAAKLPEVALKRPTQVIGSDTVGSMQSGFFFGTVGLIDEIVKRIHDEIGKKTVVIATGGLAALVAGDCKSISKIRPTLTLEGLMIIYGMNASQNSK